MVKYDLCHICYAMSCLDVVDSKLRLRLVLVLVEVSNLMILVVLE